MYNVFMLFHNKKKDLKKVLFFITKILICKINFKLKTRQIINSIIKTKKKLIERFY